MAKTNLKSCFTPCFSRELIPFYKHPEFTPIRAAAQVTGAVTARVGQGGRILAVYKDGGGQSAGSDVLWRSPLNFSGSTQVQDTFTANANAATMQLALESDLDAGHLAFSGLGLSICASDVIRCSTYSVGGQATAVKVQGDPEAGKNGIFFLYSDHLGSTSVMSFGYHPDGSLHPLVLTLRVMLESGAR